MVTLVLMVVLVVVAGWLDTRLNWQHAGHHAQEEVRQ